MSPKPPPPLPRSRIPAWERRRAPDRWRWNGRRNNDPRLPRLTAASLGQILYYAFAGSVLGLLMFLLAMR